MKTKFQGKSKENSYIFTGAEKEAIYKRMNIKNYTDSTGAFTRASNKILEILKMTDTIQKRRLLYKLIDDKRYKKIKDKVIKNDEMSLEKFREDKGW